MTGILVLIAALLFLLLSLIGFLSFSQDFSRELRFLNTEIGRSAGEDRRRWLRRRRRLWLSLLPFVKY